ncbi:MAG: hypothetical protein HYV27_10320 [Candidatus Hydrogenedentes bacterium]|nr:hypothetical protein [Candidatus Hydrogenedentota bacterium]
MELLGGANTKLILVHWEPHAYARFPATRDHQLLLDILMASLMYREVLIKDTDLILNERVISVLREPKMFDTFTKLLELGFVKILLRKVEDHAHSGLDPVTAPLTFRAHNIRSFYADDWKLLDHRRKFYAAVDQVLLRCPNATESVTAWPHDRNPFAQWFGELLGNWQEVSTIPEFRGIDGDVAKLLKKFCHEDGAWLDFLSKQSPALVKPGDDDRLFLRSQVSRCLHALGGEHPGIENLMQSVFHGLYCYTHEASGTFHDGIIVEPPRSGVGPLPMLGGTSQRLHLLPAGSTSMEITPDLVDAVHNTRRSNSGAFEDLQFRLRGVSAGTAQETAVHKALAQVVAEFAENIEKLRRPNGYSPIFSLTWNVLGLEGVALALGFGPLQSIGLTTATGLMSMAPSALELYRSRSSAASVAREIKTTVCRFRGSHLEIPSAIGWR